MVILCLREEGIGRLDVVKTLFIVNQADSDKKINWSIFEID